MPLRRMLPFILLNVVVSAVVVLAILFWWDNRQQEEEQPTVVAAVVPTLAVELATTAPTTQLPQAAESQASGPETYVVKPGDTLGSISRSFDVSIDDLMAANGIDDPNFLKVDQELIIPSGEGQAAFELAVTPEATETPLPGVPPTPIPTPLPAEGEAVIEISEVIGAGLLDEEAVRIANTGERPIALLGWRLADEDGRLYTFGQVTLFGDGAAILVHSGNGQEGPADLYWGLDEAVWQAGETVTLLDPEGTIRSTYIVGEH